MGNNVFRVPDQYRTNNLSLQPGGHEVSVTFSTGETKIYDKVKKPGPYIKALTGEITLVLLDGKQVWQKGDNKKAWEIQ